jgi:predicted phage gp36 major capsid-like protein
VLLHGDLKNYCIADRVGTTVSHIPMVFGANQRPTFQQGWAVYFRTGAVTVSSNGFELLKL